ncbi:MAG: histidinol-phosphatase HisJ, partial [Candidatus Hodarchaeales archaeon]
MLLPGDYHTHSYLCNHADGHLSDYIHTAITLGLPAIGLSAHFPMHLLPSQFHTYAMTVSELNGYLTTAQELRENFKSKIQTKIAFEVDFHKPLLSQYKQLLNPYLKDLDYLIGSIHGLKWNGYIIPIAQSVSLPEELAYDKNGIDSLILSYYKDLRELIRTNYYDVLGHFDVIKKLGFVSKDEEKIWESILQVMDDLESSNMAVEINTSGLRLKNRELYPQNSIIKELIQRKIPLIIGSDAHKPADVGYAFDSTVNFLKKMGV